MLAGFLSEPFVCFHVPVRSAGCRALFVFLGFSCKLVVCFRASELVEEFPQQDDKPINMTIVAATAAMPLRICASSRLQGTAIEYNACLSEKNKFVFSSDSKGI